MRFLILKGFSNVGKGRDVWSQSSIATWSISSLYLSLSLSTMLAKTPFSQPSTTFSVYTKWIIIFSTFPYSSSFSSPSFSSSLCSSSRSSHTYKRKVALAVLARSPLSLPWGWVTFPWCSTATTSSWSEWEEVEDALSC